MASLTFSLRLKRAFFGMAQWLKSSVAFVFRLAELLWRCAYPALASALLLVFFVGLSQGNELIKIFISGERSPFEYYALPAAFGCASLIFLLVARCILQRRWESVFSRGEVDRVSPSWVNALPFFIGVAPLLGLSWVCYRILGELREVSAEFCGNTPAQQCALRTTESVVPQWVAFLLAALLISLIAWLGAGAWPRVVKARRFLKRFQSRAYTPIICLAVLLWFVFLVSGGAQANNPHFAFALDQMNLQRAMGSVHILIIAAISWTVIGGLVLTLWAKRFFGVSLILLPAFLMLFAASFRDGDHDVRELTLTEQPAPGKTIGQSLEAYAVSVIERRAAQGLANEGATMPIYLVAAAGGGLRAGYWSAGVLADLQDANPEFANHVFLISGVSGGALGGATFLAAHRDGCLRTGSGARDVLGDCVRRVLEDVSLAPSIAATLYGDFWRSLWPRWLYQFGWKWFGLKQAFEGSPDRAHYLERTWESSFSWCIGQPEPVSKNQAFDTYGPRPFRCAARPARLPDGVSLAERDIFSMGFMDLWRKQNPAKPLSWMPNLIVNGTDVATGRRILSANLRLNPGEFPESYIARTDDPSRLNMRLSSVVHNGARFPVVSPAGRLTTENSAKIARVESPPSLVRQAEDSDISQGALMMCATTAKEKLCEMPPQSVHRIVDGGYSDNSGLDTIEDVLDEIENFNDAQEEATKSNDAPGACAAALTRALGKGVSAGKPKCPKLSANLIIIDNQGWPDKRVDGASVKALESVFKAFTLAKDARSAHDIADRVFRSSSKTQGHVFTFNLDRSGAQVPGLGWALSESSTNQMIWAASEPTYAKRVADTLAPLRIDSGAQFERRIDDAVSLRAERCVSAYARVVTDAGAVGRACAKARLQSLGLSDDR